MSKYFYANLAILNKSYDNLKPFPDIQRRIQTVVHNSLAALFISLRVFCYSFFRERTPTEKKEKKNPDDASFFLEEKQRNITPFLYDDHYDADKVKISGFESVTVLEKAKYNFFQIHTKILEIRTKVAAAAERRWKSILEGDEGGQEADKSLLFSFLSLFTRESLKQINTITHRHLDFYYRDALQVAPLPASPNRAFVAVSLKPVYPGLFLKRGTEFEKGYRLVEDSVFTQAKIAEVKKIFFQNSRLYSCEKADTPGKPWPLFEKNGEDSKLATMGFALSSSILNLEAGTRIIRLFFDNFDGPRLNFDGLENLFNIFISTEKGWQEIPLRPSEKEKAGKLNAFFDCCSAAGSCPASGNCLFFDSCPIDSYDNLYFNITLKPSFGAVVGDKDKTFGSDKYPVIRFVMDQTVNNAWKTAGSIFFRKIQVEVKDYNNLVLHNDAGPIKVGKPFLPFGSLAEAGSGFYFYCKEAFLKPIGPTAVKWEWKSAPKGSLENHYVHYYEDSRRIRFKIKPSVVNGEWEGEERDFTEDVSGFNSMSITKDMFSDIPEEENKDPEKIPSGSVKLTLTSPDFGFGKKAYSEAQERVIREIVACQSDYMLLKTEVMMKEFQVTEGRAKEVTAASQRFIDSLESIKSEAQKARTWMDNALDKIMSVFKKSFSRNYPPDYRLKNSLDDVISSTELYIKDFKSIKTHIDSFKTKLEKAKEEAQKAKKNLKEAGDDVEHAKMISQKANEAVEKAPKELEKARKELEKAQKEAGYLAQEAGKGCKKSQKELEKSLKNAQKANEAFLKAQKNVPGTKDDAKKALKNLEKANNADKAAKEVDKAAQKAVDDAEKIQKEASKKPRSVGWDSIRPLVDSAFKRFRELESKILNCARLDDRTEKINELVDESVAVFKEVQSAIEALTDIEKSKRKLSAAKAKLDQAQKKLQEINPPYIPIFKSISLEYQAECDLSGEYPFELFHITPFGYGKGEVRADKRYPLLPSSYVSEDDNLSDDHELEGALLLGFSDLKPPEPLSLFFNFVQDTAEEPLLRPGEIDWLYLSSKTSVRLSDRSLAELKKYETSGLKKLRNIWHDSEKTFLDSLKRVDNTSYNEKLILENAEKKTMDTWKKLEDSDILEDGTKGLTRSGIIQFDIPADCKEPTTLFPQKLRWLQCRIAGGVKGVNRVDNIYPQSAEIVQSDTENGEGEIGLKIPAQSIAKLANPIPETADIVQPAGSFGGKEGENYESFLVRVSERLRHKGRAVSHWDYSRLILSKFPCVEKVLCLNHTGPENENTNSLNEKLRSKKPGWVTMVLIPKLIPFQEKHPFQPRLPWSKIEEIREYIQPLTSKQTELYLRLPDYREVFLTVCVKIKKGRKLSFYKSAINETIQRAISSWAFENEAEKNEIDFATVISASNIVNPVRKLDYVSMAIPCRIAFNLHDCYPEASFCEGKFSEIERCLGDRDSNADAKDTLLLNAENNYTVFYSAKEHLIYEMTK